MHALGLKKASESDLRSDFVETFEHLISQRLPRESVTLCAGSRGGNEYIVCVHYILHTGLVTASCFSIKCILPLFW